MDEEGNFDIQKARETGAVYALKKVKIRNCTRRCKDGTVEETVAQEVGLRDKNISLELMGRRHDLWSGDIGDPEELLSRLTGIPKHLLPTSLDEPYIVEDVVESSDETEQSAISLPRESTALPAHLMSDANSEDNHNLETTTESEVPYEEMALERDGKFEEDDFNRQSSEDKKR